MNENILENQSSQAFFDETYNCSAELLFKRIKEISITDSRIRDAFKLFVSSVEANGSISVADVIFSANDVLRKKSLDESAGNAILCFDENTNSKKILKNTVNGFYSLLKLSNGVSLDIDAIGDKFSSAELKKYLIIPSKKVDKFIKIANKEGIKLKNAGNVLSINKIVINQGKDIIETFDKSQLYKDDEAISVTMGTEHFEAFSQGYSSLLSCVLCDCVSNNNLICFGVSSDISTALAMAIGYFAAAVKTKSMLNKIKFLPNTGITTVAPRPAVEDGDYFFLLKLRNLENGLPDLSHFIQLKYYITEYKNRGVIKNVLPFKENIDGTLRRLSTDSLVYDSIAEVNEKCFGVVVSVKRGESVNGIKLGYFKSV